MEEENEKIFEGKWYAYPPIRNALIAGLLTGLTFGLGDLEILNHVVEISIYTVSILIGGYYWMKEGVEDLFTKRKIGIEILMMAATIGACILNFWNEAAFLVFIYALAEGFEGYTFAKTRTSIRKLLDLAPKMARIIRNGKEETIPAEEIKVGDIFIVKPGESLPTDGIIIKGKSFINQAPVTGESIPVEKKEGMKVFAATMNQEGSLEVRTTAAFCGRTFQHIQEIQGREENVIFLPGKSGEKVRIEPDIFFDGMVLLPIDGWQVVQEREDAITFLILGPHQDFNEAEFLKKIEVEFVKRGANAPTLKVEYIKELRHTKLGKLITILALKKE